MWHVQATCTSCYNEARNLAFIGNGRISGQQMISLNKSKYIDYLTLLTHPEISRYFSNSVLFSILSTQEECRYVE